MRPGISLHIHYFLIYNKSISVAAIPLEWKLAEVIAMHKIGAKSERGNYRPVSLTSICCKILESFIRDHTMSYLLHQKQSGFIKGRSSMLQLLHMLDKWTEYLD